MVNLIIAKVPFSLFIILHIILLALAIILFRNSFIYTRREAVK